MIARFCGEAQNLGSSQISPYDRRLLHCSSYFLAINYNVEAVMICLYG